MAGGFLCLGSGRRRIVGGGSIAGLGRGGVRRRRLSCYTGFRCMKRGDGGATHKAEYQGRTETQQRDPLSVGAVFHENTGLDYRLT